MRVLIQLEIWLIPPRHKRTFLIEESPLCVAKGHDGTVTWNPLMWLRAWYRKVNEHWYHDIMALFGTKETQASVFGVFRWHCNSILPPPLRSPPTPPAALPGSRLIAVSSRRG